MLMIEEHHIVRTRKLRRGPAEPSRGAPQFSEMLRYRIIAAITRDSRGIGKDGVMPWPKLGADMKHFRELTVGGVVIVGRVTFEKIGVLENRLNVVLCRSRNEYRGENLIGARSLEQAEMLIGSRGFQVANIIGGQSVYKTAFEVPRYSQRLHLTEIENSYECDRFFPAFHDHQKIFESVQHEENGIRFTFSEWEAR
ncbi:hypothetical protein NDN08_003958 [Rhodosorus marinus]|uniref:dihydrofolate reductase n=1 Tax=Rhodosorus marinus TaxID=101924 RepID=A0AAV8UKG2_9RHOD|nr:hypothetical protein NDN08_003958 [Rhodosorus marinus]